MGIQLFDGWAIKKQRFWVVIFVAAIVALATACGSDDPAPAAAPAAQPTVAAEPTSAPSPTATSVPVLAIVDDPVVPAEIPEPGSDKAAILERFEAMVHAINLEDFGAALTGCNPTLAFPITPDEASFLFEEVRQTIGLPAYNRQNVTFRQVGEDFASTRSDEYRYDELVNSAKADSWVKVDGEWYSNSTICHGGNLATIDPTPEPAQAQAEITPLDELETRPFPALLLDDAEKLDREQVVALWTEYLGGARFGDTDPSSTAAYYCGDGTGQVLNDPGDVYSTGVDRSFGWWVESRPGSRWNDVTFLVLPADDSRLNPLSPDGSYSWSLNVDGSTVLASSAFPIGEAFVTQHCS